MRTKLKKRMEHRQKHMARAKRRSDLKKSDKEIKDGTFIPLEKSTPATRPATVVYLGHLPRGFSERELETFTSQYGEVTGCRIARNTVSGASKGYGWVRFASPVIAEKARFDLEGYSLQTRCLKAAVVKPNVPEKNLFRDSSIQFLRQKDIRNRNMIVREGLGPNVKRSFREYIRPKDFGKVMRDKRVRLLASLKAYSDAGITLPPQLVAIGNAVDATVKLLDEELAAAEAKAAAEGPRGAAGAAAAAVNGEAHEDRSEGSSESLDSSDEEALEALLSPPMSAARSAKVPKNLATPTPKKDVIKAATPGSKVAAAKAATPGSKVAAAKAATPGSKVAAAKAATPGSKVAAAKAATPGSKVAAAKAATPGSKVAAAKAATPGSKVAAAKAATPGSVSKRPRS